MDFQFNSDLFFKIVIPILTAILGFIFGIKREHILEKRSKLNQSFDNLYEPFEMLIMKKTIGAFLFSDLDNQLQNEIFNLLINNYKYADQNLKRLINEFRWIYQSSHLDKDDLNKTFFKLQCQISSEFDKRCDKLYYQKIKW